ncbi:MAG TPA: aminodeoxychorismate synthase component I [Gammaproteobacteria bacterium]|nr:aminodeoxychorismate synthase component I [Gammaproteobacteria bacterium]
MLRCEAQQSWLLFERPQRILTAHGLEDVPDVLAEAQTAIARENLHAAGFVSYESAPAFDKALTARPGSEFPYVWFGLYRTVLPVSLPRPGTGGELPEIDWQASVSDAEYRAAIGRIKHYIREGDTYQVNYTFRLRGPDVDDPWRIFLAMIAAQGRTLGAFIQGADWCVSSASHELFFRLDGDELTSRPMKGTVTRGLTQGEDLAREEWLRNSAKNRAENIMIVDMIRNDMGRIARTGSVKATNLFEIEKYPTLWQMTSTVSCRTRAGLRDIFQALFPCASITGAPKRRTMEIIREVESTPRGLYTGAIGYFSPNRRAQFSVAIRTVTINHRDAVMEYGTGGGVVWDSEPEDELAECLAKARIVTRPAPEFSLLETLLWTPDSGCFLLEEHLRRLRNSAAYFDFNLDEPGLLRRIAECTAGLTPVAHRLRVLAHRNGEIQLEAEPLSTRTGNYHVILAAAAVKTTDPFLYHKTTRRDIYKYALAAAPGHDDVLLWNERGELTESCIANLVVELDGNLHTPPVTCGLLAGVYRETLLREGRISERIIRKEELPVCSRIYLINSVRGMWEIQLPGANTPDGPGA